MIGLIEDGQKLLRRMWVLRMGFNERAGRVPSVRCHSDPGSPKHAGFACVGVGTQPRFLRMLMRNLLFVVAQARRRRVLFE